MRVGLIAHAQALFELSKPAADGASQRDHLEAAARASGEKIPELDVPPLPPSCAAVWGAFIELHNARPPGMSGAAAIQWRDVAAWQDVRGVRLTPWEVETISALDRVALEIFNRDKPK